MRQMLRGNTIFATIALAAGTSAHVLAKDNAAVVKLEVPACTMRQKVASSMRVLFYNYLLLAAVPNLICLVDPMVNIFPPL